MGDNGALALLGWAGSNSSWDHRYHSQSSFPARTSPVNGSILTDRVNAARPTSRTDIHCLRKSDKSRHVAANAKVPAASLRSDRTGCSHKPAPQQSLRRVVLPFFKHDEHAVIGLRRTETVDTLNGSDDDYVRGGARKAIAWRFIRSLSSSSLMVAFLLDVHIRGRHVGFGLVEFVVAHKYSTALSGKTFLNSW